MIVEPLLIHKVESVGGQLRGHGIHFGRFPCDPSTPTESPSEEMWVVYPQAVKIVIGREPVTFRSWVQVSGTALADVIVSPDRYHLRGLDRDLPPCPIIISASRLAKVGTMNLTVRLHSKSIATLPEFEAFLDLLRRAHSRFRSEEFAPGLSLPIGPPPTAAMADGILLKEGFWLAVEPEVMDIDISPMVLRLGKSLSEDVFDAVLFWVDDQPSLRPGATLWRRLLPMPGVNGRFRERSVATVLRVV